MYAVNLYVLTRAGPIIITESNNQQQQEQVPVVVPAPSQRKTKRQLEEEYKADTSKFLTKGLTGQAGIDFYFGKPNPHPEPLTSTAQVFAEAGVELDAATLEELPTWQQLSDLLGEPKLVGLEQNCKTFQSILDPTQRNVGCSGMFNSGTNLVTQLLKNNCKVPERVALYGTDATKEAHGIRWQVPWGKHTNSKYREEHATKQASKVNKTSVLPIVTIRNPYNWMESMCKNAYTAKWAPHSYPDHCPNLVDPNTGKPHTLHVKYAENRQDEHESLAHLWNDWYNSYYHQQQQQKFPYLMVRFEDLIFHSKSVTTQICECMGGKIRTDQAFQYIVESAKDGPGHGKVSERTGMVMAWLKYSKTPSTKDHWSEQDRTAAKEFLSQELMDLFGYRHPPPT